MNKHLAGFCIFLFGMALSLQAKNPVWLGDNQSASLRYAMAGLHQTDAEQTAPSHTAETTSLKKPGLGALFSAAVPGAGQIYAGSWFKSAVFLGAEIGIWVGYAAFYNEGKDWENQFHAYADAHWSEADYWIAIAEEAGVSGVTTVTYPDYLEELRDWEHNNQHHSLPEEKNQQYYEVIGKYDFFAVGWEDYSEDGSKLTPMRNEYETMRNNSNVEFKRASTCAMVALANHMISALDAAWTISKQNRKIRTSAYIKLKPIRNEMVPLYGFNVQW